MNEVKSREILQLCDIVPIEGREFIIYSIKSFLENSQVFHTYVLKPRGAFCSIRKYNKNIVGASLEGKIVEVEEDRVRVCIDDDIRQKRYKWFLHATPFSVPDGYGWYFMPEVGDSIRLRFPTELENDAYVSSSVHVTHGDRVDPQIKYLRTIYGQELRFSPDSVVLRDGAGSSITLNHREGIYIDTDKDIKIEAGDELRISAASKMEITAKKRVTMRNNDSIVNVSENIDIVSHHSRIQ